MNSPTTTGPLAFGEFELDVNAGELRRHGRRLKLQPQPFKLLILLAGRPGAVVTRDEIRTALWPEGTFVDFDQAVNFSIKQIRDVLRDPADRPLYIETVPKRGYRFIAPVTTVGGPAPQPGPAAPWEGTTAVAMQKALWTNIAELRMADERRQTMQRRVVIAAVALLAVTLAIVVVVLVLK